MRFNVMISMLMFTTLNGAFAQGNTTGPGNHLLENADRTVTATAIENEDRSVTFKDLKILSGRKFYRPMIKMGYYLGGLCDLLGYAGENSMIYSEQGATKSDVIIIQSENKQQSGEYITKVKLKPLSRQSDEYITEVNCSNGMLKVVIKADMKENLGGIVTYNNIRSEHLGIDRKIALRDNNAFRNKRQICETLGHRDWAGYSKLSEEKYSTFVFIALNHTHLIDNYAQLEAIEEISCLD